MQQLNYPLPVATEFTDYSRWERRPSNKSGTSGGWSVWKGARGRTLGGKRQQLRRQDALPLATGLSQASMSGSRTLDNAQHLHSHCHARIKNLSSSTSSPRPVSIRRSTGSCDRKISKTQVVHSPQHTLLQVSPCNISHFLLSFHLQTQMQIEAKRNSIKEFTKYKNDLYPTYIG